MLSLIAQRWTFNETEHLDLYGWRNKVRCGDEQDIIVKQVHVFINPIDLTKRKMLWMEGVQ